MSAKIIPWPARIAVAADEPVSHLPALIDRRVPVRALRKGLTAAGLRLEHDLVTGNLVILTMQDIPTVRTEALQYKACVGDARDDAPLDSDTHC